MTAALSHAQMSFAMPVAGLTPVSDDYANELLVRWRHGLGPCRRPYGQMSWVLDVMGTPVSVAVSASIVSSHVAYTEKVPVYGLAAGRPGCHVGDLAYTVRYRRREVVELARQCSDPASRWATRPMVRLWREVAAPAWSRRYWPVKLAVSYSLNRHAGDIYRFDGWVKVRDDCGSASGGGTWTKRRSPLDPVSDTRKSLWIWHYATETGGEQR